MKMQQQSGFTLIELAMGAGISAMVAGALIGMFTAHLQMLSQASQFDFLAQDAPFIGLMLTRTIGNAEDYRIYSTGLAAKSNINPALTGKAVRLWMRQPNSTYRQAVVSFETINGHSGIYFFLTDPGTEAFSSTPDWELAGSRLKDATFDATSGVLLAKVYGYNNDWCQFAVEKK